MEISNLCVSYASFVMFIDLLMLYSIESLCHLLFISKKCHLILIFLFFLFFVPRMLKDSIDPNAIIIDKTALLNTDIDNIKYEFTKLLDKLIEKLKPIGPKTNPKEVKGKILLKQILGWGGGHLWQCYIVSVRGGMVVQCCSQSLPAVQTHAG